MEEMVVSAIQMTSSDDVHKNLSIVGKRVAEAVDSGAKLIVLPENFALMATRSQQVYQMAERLGAGPIQHFLSELSKKYGCWLVAGSLPTTSADSAKVYATCLVYNEFGEQLAHYHKMHLFDADIADGKRSYRESDTFRAGNEPVVVNTPFGMMGLSICYDLRFPELYRALLQKGAEFFVAPSAFTAVTGAAHWSLLCRARAVENSCYLIAANQGGVHINGRSTYGHSMIVDPWGEVLAELGSTEGVALATLKQLKVRQVRNDLPSIEHQRFSITRDK